MRSRVAYVTYCRLTYVCVYIYIEGLQGFEMGHAMEGLQSPV